MPRWPCQELGLYLSIPREWKRKSRYVNLVQRKQSVAEGGHGHEYALDSSTEIILCPETQGGEAIIKGHVVEIWGKH